MEDTFEKEYYADNTTQKIYLIFVITSLVANILGAVSNVFIFGMSITTIVCFSFIAIILVATIFGRVFKKYDVAMSIAAFLICAIEFPFLYFSYRISALPYLVLGIYAASIIYKGRAKVAMLSIFATIYVIIIAVGFVYPDYYDEIVEASGSVSMIISGLVSGIITTITVALTINIVIYNYVNKNNEYIELNKRLERMNHYDSLTPCYNRKFLMDYLQTNCNVRTNNGLSIVLFDIIDLGYINFKYGYTVGDQVLAEFADIVFATLKGRGIVARYDGQKFVAILYVTVQEEINKIINAVLDEFKKFSEKIKNDKFNVSYGVTICRSNFSVDDELKIVYARSLDNARKLPHRVFSEEGLMNQGE